MEVTRSNPVRVSVSCHHQFAVRQTPQLPRAVVTRSRQNLFVRVQGNAKHTAHNTTINDVHRLPKLATPLGSITLHSVCRWWILTKYCTLHYRNITYRRTYFDGRTLPCAFSVTSLWHQSLFTYIQYVVIDQAVVYSPETKSLHRGQRWPLFAQTSKTSSEWLSPQVFYIL